MRQECKNFESRTYANGETVRKCNLDLAPDAPWRCPEHCHGVRAEDGRRLDIRIDGVAADAPRTAGTRRRQRRGDPRRGRGLPQLDRSAGDVGSRDRPQRHARSVSAASCAASATTNVRPRIVGISHYAGSRISPVLAFSPDLVDPSDQHTQGRRRACSGDGPAHCRARGVALQPHRRAAARPLPSGSLRRPPCTVANGYVADRHDLDTTRVHDVFDELSASFYGETVLSIPRGTHVGRPIMVTHTVHGDDEATFPRLVIDAGENSEVTVVERFVSDGTGAALVVPRLFVRAQQAARVTYVAINELGTSVWQLGHQQAIGRSRLDHAAGHGRARRRVRPGAHRRQGRRAGRQHPPGRACTTPTRPRCTTSARCRTMSPRARPATCCSRARCKTRHAACTPG